MYYKGKLYTFFTDGDQTVLALRKDLLELPEARKAFKAKFGWEPGCPDTWKQWEELASFFQGKKGDNFYGLALDKDLYGAQEYRAREFGYRWWQGRFISKGKLFFDRNMKPLIDGPEGIETTREQVALTKHMPKDIFGWGTPQNYPFFAQGNSFSIATFPSLVGYSQNAQGTVRQGQGGQLRGAGQHGEGQAGPPLGAAGRHQLHGQQVQQAPRGRLLVPPVVHRAQVGNRAVADRDGFWEPFRVGQEKDPNIVARFGEQFMKVTLENAKIAVPMIPLQGNREYFDALDVNLQEAYHGRITPEEAMKQTARQWEKITDDIGRKKQIEAWKHVVESGAYFDAEGY